MVRFTLIAVLGVFQYVLAAPAPVLKRQSAIPSFVIDYAPMVWLDSAETHFPGDIGSQLAHTKPEVNFTAVPAPNPLTLDNLNQLNQPGVYLTSLDDIAAGTEPSWLQGVKPDSTGKTQGATSCAIIVNDHGSGLVDAFYMYFYNFNEGETVIGHLGDHVGDWEHNMIRFQDGVPQDVWFSQHANGQAFTYAATQKIGQRPVSYSAKGSHANYGIPGRHDHTIPNVNLPFQFFLTDYTSQGALWDPTLNAYTYAYDFPSNTYTPYVAGTPTNWLYYTGAWGDQQYPANDPRQQEIFNIALTAKYVGGPTGPEDKHLNRTNVCFADPCEVLPFLIARKE